MQAEKNYYFCQYIGNYIVDQSFFKLFFEANLRNYGNVDFNFHETVFIINNLSNINFCIWNRITQVKKGGCGLKSQMKNLKLNAQREIDGIQVLSEFYMTQLDDKSQLLYVSWEVGVCCEPLPPTFPLMLRVHDMHHLKTKTV